jgi:ATP-dependent Zn protease
MNPFIKKSLISFGRYVASETIKELEVVPYIKDQIKASLLYSVNITKRRNSTFFNGVEKYLLEKHSEKIQNTSFEDYITLEDIPNNRKSERTIRAAKIIIKEFGVLIYINKTFQEIVDPREVSTHEAITFSVLKPYKQNLEDFLIFLRKYTLENNTENTLTCLNSFEDYWREFRRYKPISFDNIILPKEIKDSLEKDLNNFFGKKDWYQKKGLTLKRGYLLYGAPRNGKSSIITAIAAKYRCNVFYLNLNSLASDIELIKAIRDIPSNSIVAVEDIDTIWNKRTAKNINCKINIETFMNILSGSYERDGLIYFFTTNFIEDLDEAMIGDRRIDMKIHIDNPKKSEVEAYLSNLYEFPVKLTSYEDRSRSMGNILNLFLKYSENHLELCKILENV